MRRDVARMSYAVPTVLLGTALASALLSLMSGAPAHARQGSVLWTFPTRADNARFSVKLGGSLMFTLAASTSTAAAAAIDPVLGLPPGATLSSYSGASRTRAIFRWRPLELGDYTLRFVASVGSDTAPPRTYVVRVIPDVRYPHAYTLTDRRVAHWANVMRRTVVRSQPSLTAQPVTTIGPFTSDATQNVVLVLGGVDLSPTRRWYRVRLAILPNNSTGWVRSDALGDLVEVDTHLYVDRARFTISLERKGVAVFRSTVGVGRPFWPTPRGEFYIRVKLARFRSPMYGPIAFGTSARSPTLTDWPGGGVVGIHGTDQPELLPGPVSHGCIRMRNADIVRLAPLVKIGTPLTIR
jgi:hypothetical protein